MMRRPLVSVVMPTHNRRALLAAAIDSVLAQTLDDFELLTDLNGLNQRKDIDVAVVCCPWPQYRDLKFSPATKVLSTWQL